MEPVIQGNFVRRTTAVLPWLTTLCVVLQVISLRSGLFATFFFDAMHADVQGIDYFSLPKAFLNLTHGLSMYDSFSGISYGPHLTWYLSHPALAVWLGSWLSFLPPWPSYVLFVVLSFTLMCICAWLLAAQTRDTLVRRLIWFLLLGSFPTYWMYFVGNVQALLVLALGMLFAGLFAISNGRQGSGLVFFGLLLSLLSKPVALLMLPLLIFVPETRRRSLQAFTLYLLISVVFEGVPFLNPSAIGWQRILSLGLHPQYVREHMNVYANHFQIHAEMLDNSIHWFNLVAQSGFRLAHVDVFSLPVFLDSLLGIRTPDWPYAIPIVIVLPLTLAVVALRDRYHRGQASLLLAMLASLAFFLTYNTVWEYQYTSVLPVGAGLLLLGDDVVMARNLRITALAAVFLIWMPSLYWLVEGKALSPSVLTLIRLDRIVPVTMLFVVLTIAVIRLVLTSRRSNAIA